MSVETIDHAAMMKLAESGGGLAVHVVGQGGGWGIVVKCGTTERTLTAHDAGDVRIFQRFETLLEYLKGLGILRFVVNGENYDTDRVTDQTRLDPAVALNGADAAASYTNWLKAEVQAALDDASPTVPHEEAMRQVRAAIKR